VQLADAADELGPLPEESPLTFTRAFGGRLDVCHRGTSGADGE
jgi:hypothetical protein